MKITLPYVHRDTDRHGNVRYYYRRRPGAPKIRIRSVPGRPDFVAGYKDAEQRAGLASAAMPPGLKRIQPNTWSWLCMQYLNAPEFRRLDPSTVRTRRNILISTFEEPVTPGGKERFADFPLSRMTAKAVRVLRDRKANFPEAANARVKAVRRVFSWGVDNDHTVVNPARDVQRIAHTTEGHHTWTVDEVIQYERRHPVGSTARLALALLMYTGVRRSDVVLLGRQHVRDGWFKFTQQKNRNRKPVMIELPILPVLQSIIDRSPAGDLTFLITEHGKPFTNTGFGSWFRARCDEAGLDCCSAHGLRKAAAAIAAENGATTNQLMAMFGWLSISEAQRYTQAAQRKKMAGDGTPLLIRRETTNREQIIPTGPGSAVPTDFKPLTSLRNSGERDS